MMTPFAFSSLRTSVSANRAKSLTVKYLQQEKAQREKPFEGFKMVFYNVQAMVSTGIKSN